MTGKEKDVLALSVDVRALAFRKTDCGVQEVYRKKKKKHIRFRKTLFFIFTGRPGLLKKHFTVGKMIF